MALPIPNLDDRDYARLLADAKALIPTHAPEWTDLSPGDPGVTLLELMAYLTESMLFRLNRLPEKAYVAFLNLVGVTLTPPAAAKVDLTFSVKTAGTEQLTIPRGTRVTTARPGGPVFTTMADAVIAAGATSAKASALHCELHFGERLGLGTGQPGQRVTVSSAPIVLESGDAGDLYVGVEATPDELGDRVAAIRHGNLTYRLWREVPHFGVDAGDGYVFTADRTDGVVSFTPFSDQLLMADGQAARPPAAGRQIRAWYRTGGGAAGNVKAGTLTVLKDPIKGVSVTNEQVAAGGRDGETLAQALLRGANQVNTFDRVVTAGDYERVAVACSGGVSRAIAVTEAALWTGAQPGRVRVLVVPSVNAEEILGVNADQLVRQQVPSVLDRVSQVLAERQPVGVTSSVGWVGLKRFHVEATAVVNRAEDRDAVKSRLLDRLARTLNPLPFEGQPGWGFGEALRASTVYDVLLAERGVRFVENVRLVVDEVPGDVTALVADPHQAATWFCASDSRIFRTTDDADGWERVARFDGESVERLSSCPGRPGLLVASSRIGDTESSRVRVSADYGETWQVAAEFDFHVEDVTAGVAVDRPAVFLATDKGLYRLDVVPGAVPEAILVDAANVAKPFYAVQVVSEPGGELQVAVAAQELGGVSVSFQGGRAGTYQPLGLTGVDVRLLRVQRSPGRRFLLTGAFATGDEAGAGVSRVELLPYQPSAEGWKPVGKSWVGGICRDLAFEGERVYAATARSGVTVADTSAPDQAWRAARVDCGLPLREVGRFQPVIALAARPGNLLVGSIGGAYSSIDGSIFTHASETVFTERVSLPQAWLFAPSEHQLTVRYDDART